MIKPGACLILDFDGTLIDSNQVKKELYLEIFSDYSVIRNDLLLFINEYYGKFNREKIVTKVLEYLQVDFDYNLVNSLSIKYSELYKGYASKCEEIRGTSNFLNKMHKTNNLYINTANPEVDIREIICNRSWSSFFKGVFGKPSTKKEIINHIIEIEKLRLDFFYMVGDSQEDFDSALDSKIKFIGVSNKDSNFYKEPETLVNKVEDIIIL